MGFAVGRPTGRARDGAGFFTSSLIIVQSSSSVSSESAWVFITGVVALTGALLFGSTADFALVVLVKVVRGAVRAPRLTGDGGRTAARAIMMLW